MRRQALKPGTLTAANDATNAGAGPTGPCRGRTALHRAAAIASDCFKAGVGGRLVAMRWGGELGRGMVFNTEGAEGAEGGQPGLVFNVAKRRAARAAGNRRTEGGGQSDGAEKDG
jgi:hypothetical protein